MEPLTQLEFVADTEPCYLTLLKHMNSDKVEAKFSFNHCLLALVSTELIFCSGQDPEVILYHLTSLPGVGKRNSSEDKGFCSSQTWQRGVVWFCRLLGRDVPCELFLSCIPCHWYCSVAVHCLISFLFPVNCCCLSPWSLPFVPPILSVSQQRRVRGESRGARESQWEH